MGLEVATALSASMAGPMVDDEAAGENWDEAAGENWDEAAGADSGRTGELRSIRRAEPLHGGRRCLRRARLTS